MLDKLGNWVGQSADDAQEVAYYMMLFNQMRIRRVNFEAQWEESAALAWPEYMASFYYGRDVAPGFKRTQFQIDSSVSISSHRFGAIVDWLVTPSNLVWSKIKASNPDLMKQRIVKDWFDKVTNILWCERYKATGAFVANNSQNMQGLGVFGNMGMFIDELADFINPTERGIRYLGLPVGEIYLECDHQKRPVGFVRHFRLDAQQFKYRWPDFNHSIVEARLAIGSKQLFDVLHFVRPREDYKPEYVFLPQGKKYESTYLFVQGMCLIDKSGGYRINPLAYGRYMVAPDEDYGRGPMQMVLASAKTKNAMMSIFLKQAHRAGDPAYIVPDEGLVDLKWHSGAINAGMMSNDGKPLVGILPTGQIQMTEEAMKLPDEVIKDAFLVNLFQLVLGDKNFDMSPRQVLEYINERGILLYPTVGRQSTEYCGPLIDRELDILSFQQKLPPMPPVLREARADYTVEYTNPITRAMQLQESAGYVRTFEFGAEAVKSGADPSLLDIFDLDIALPEIGERDNAPLRWFATQQMLTRKRQQRAQAAERENQVKELPGRAAIMKAQAIQAQQQGGQMPGGVGSGTPQGGMPMMPGQQQPGGRNFGGQMPQGPIQPQLNQ